MGLHLDQSLYQALGYKDSTLDTVMKSFKVVILERTLCAAASFEPSGTSVCAVQGHRDLLSTSPGLI